MQSVGQLYADICRSEPREMVITPFEEGWTSMIVVVVLSIIFASKRVSIDITVLMSSQESEAKGQFQSERATTVKPHRVTGCDTAATTFALPAFPSIESEIIANSLAIDSNEWSAERPLSTEIAPQLHLEVTNLEELVAVLVVTPPNFPVFLWWMGQPYFLKSEIKRSISPFCVLTAIVSNSFADWLVLCLWFAESS